MGKRYSLFEMLYAFFRRLVFDLLVDFILIFSQLLKNMLNAFFFLFAATFIRVQKIFGLFKQFFQFQCRLP